MPEDDFPGNYARRWKYALICFLIHPIYQSLEPLFSFDILDV